MSGFSTRPSVQGISRPVSSSSPRTLVFANPKPTDISALPLPTSTPALSLKTYGVALHSYTDPGSDGDGAGGDAEAEREHSGEGDAEAEIVQEHTMEKQFQKLHKEMFNAGQNLWGDSLEGPYGAISPSYMNSYVAATTKMMQHLIENEDYKKALGLDPTSQYLVFPDDRAVLRKSQRYFGSPHLDSLTAASHLFDLTNMRDVYYPQSAAPPTIKEYVEKQLYTPTARSFSGNLDVYVFF